LEVYFRAQFLSEVIGSLDQGIRRYQNPALADLVNSELDGVATGGRKLRQYIAQLAAAQENQFKVMAAEAQRCRVSLSGQAPARSRPSRGTESK